MTLSGAKKATVALFIPLMVLTAGEAWADRASSDRSGDYVSLLMIGSLSTVSGTSSSSGVLLLRNDADLVGAVGLAVGYNWAKKGVPIRSEIEYHYRARFDFDSRVLDSAGYENQLSSHALIVNAYYDYQMNDRWALFVGGGLGWAQNVSEVSRVPLIGGQRSELTNRTNNLSWNAALGAIWSFSRNWDAEFRYRYIELGEVESGPHIDGQTIKAESYNSHDLILGTTYRF